LAYEYCDTVTNCICKYESDKILNGNIMLFSVSKSKLADINIQYMNVFYEGSLMPKKK